MEQIGEQRHALGIKAACAKVHGTILVTRNIADIASTGVEYLNPFERNI